MRPRRKARVSGRLDRAIVEKQVWNLHGLVVIRSGRSVLERYFDDEDRARGVGALGHVELGPGTLHDLRSCLKSIVGLL